ncbi:MAG: AmmeMemoRadiSam system radical SAM enzyme [Herpetosiphonaceae bacterium]|nr:MAG: AmmeMemoRadiSam system radical SAM enzyme [Herpetosiphonaceae bacterium]
MATEQTLADVLDQMTTDGELYSDTEDGRIHCYACAHNCIIGEGRRGICKVRFNEGGRLRVPWGYVGALQCDPVEKKPFWHAMPGSDALTFGMLGCDLHCAYCQNWITSQALRDTNAGALPMQITPRELVALARAQGAKFVVSSYNEPLITSEWAVAVFKEAKAAGLLTGYVSNGNATREVLEYIRPWTDCYKIDLKTMSDRNYRKLGTKLDHVLEGVRLVHELGFWLEVLTLVVPGFNDSDAELREAAQFVASVSPDIPWHVTAFHPDYKMMDHDYTTARHLLRAVEFGREAGLRYIYAGNLPGQVGPWEHTRCPECQATLIERIGYVILDYRLTPEGTCPDCGTMIPGLWPKGARAEVRLGSRFDLYQRIPRPVRRLRSDLPG